MYYVFQESMIFEGSGKVDPDAKKISIKAKDEDRARKRLPKPSSIGRNWILVGTK